LGNFHLFPLSFNELGGTPGEVLPPWWALGPSGPAPRWDVPKQAASRLRQFLRRGPFPEPLLADSDRFSRRWAADYLSLVVRQDLRDLTRISQLERVETLVELLPTTVGSLFSHAALGRQLEVAHTTVKIWMEALRRLYVVFSVRPYSKRLHRALRKGQKWYFLDWSHVPEGPARFENLVASALWQACQAWTDAGHGRYELRYLRTLDRREIDLVVLRDGRPRCAIEVKEGDLAPSAPLRRRAEYLGADLPGFQVVAIPDVARQVEPGLWIISVERLLSQLP
jgi:predicted AAA+ superfamily ATPase